MLWATGPPLLFGLRLWASVCLALYVAFWLELDDPFWAGETGAIVCQPQLGASLRKGWFRMIGTPIGAVAIVVLTACFPQDRGLFLVGLALWGAVCALVATILRNWAAYAAALAGYTAVIIASDELGATGGTNGEAFTLALTRVSEISIGIVSAGVVLAVTDLGEARRRLSTLFAELARGITTHVTTTLALAGPELPDTQLLRRDFIRRVIALDPLIDETLGESSQIRYHSPVLQKAVDGLFAALSAWRAIANHLVRSPSDQARAAATAALERIPSALIVPGEDAPTRWITHPADLHRTCDEAVHGLLTLPTHMPSLRLLAEKTAEALVGISQALNGLALLIGEPAWPVARGRSIFHLRVPDWLPALINAGRSFVTIGAVALFWIITAWPNGAIAISWAAIPVILFAPRADQAYASAKGFTIGLFLAAAFAAISAFSVLPALEKNSFLTLSVAIGIYLVPTGALVTQPRQKAMFSAMTSYFVAFLGPTNPMSYDTVRFYNAALAIVAALLRHCSFACCHR